MAAVHPSQEAAAFDDSGRIYRLITDTIPLMVWGARADGAVDYVNRRVLEYSGMALRELLGGGWATMVHPDDRERCAAVWLQALARGERSENDMRLRRADGTYRWHHGSGVPVRGADGRISRWFGICTDIDEELREQRQAQQALRESQQRFELFMRHVPAPAWVKDHRLRYAYVNRAYEEVYGRAAADVLGREDFDLHEQPLAAFFREEDERIVRTGQPTQRTHGVPYADGRPGHWLVTKFPLADADGRTSVAGIAIDITERNRLEEALRASEQRFRAFMEHAPARAWIKDSSLRYTFVNARFARDHGRGEQEFLGRQDFELFSREMARYFRDDDEQVVRGKPPMPQLRRIARADGFVEHWLTAKFPIADSAGGTGLAGIAFDVTDRVEAENKAQRYADEVHSLVGRLVQAQEAERRRVADGLHDLIGQNLTALGIDLQALKQSLGAAGEGAAGARLDAMAQIVDTTVDAIRGVMTDLRPTALEEFGLVPALRWYASQFSKRTGLKASTKMPRRELRLAADAELALFRIAQEALTNAAKHSGASSVEIRIRYGERVILTVQDDGRGFTDPVGARAARRGGGFGLTAMRERAEAHGGTLRIEFPERGTRVVVEIPAGRDGD